MTEDQTISCWQQLEDQLIVHDIRGTKRRTHFLKDCGTNLLSAYVAILECCGHFDIDVVHCGQLLPTDFLDHNMHW